MNFSNLPSLIMQDTITQERTERLRMFRNDLRMETGAQPLRDLLASMRSDYQARPTDYLRGYVAALEFALNLLGINE